MLTVGTDIRSTIVGIFRNASLIQTRQFSGCEALELVELDDSFQLGQVLARQMILIVISGAELRILFKIHFNSSASDRLRRVKFRTPITDERIAAAKTLDYMKELTNQVCGRICRIFQRNELVLGMCIPLSMHGFYELYTDYALDDGKLKKFGDAWKINGDFGSLVCTAYVEIMEPTAVTNLQYVDEEVSNDDDELEFL
ncbi:MAG: hypothetical protein V4732_12825 [Pseudomonadota bacterium]